MESSSKKSAWTRGSGGARGSIRKVAISRSASSRTMSAADRLRSWRSASKNNYRDHGKVRSGGRPGGETAGRHRARERSSGRQNVRHCGRDRSSRKHRNGPQSRANNQTHVLGGEHAETHMISMIGDETNKKRHAPVETHTTSRPTVKHGLQSGREDGQCQVQSGPQSRLKLRMWVRSHGGVENPKHQIMRLQRVLSGKWYERLTISSATKSLTLTSKRRQSCNYEVDSCYSLQSRCLRRSRCGGERGCELQSWL